MQPLVVKLCRGTSKRTRQLPNRSQTAKSSEGFGKLHIKLKIRPPARQSRLLALPMHIKQPSMAVGAWVEDFKEDPIPLIIKEYTLNYGGLNIMIYDLRYIP